MDAPPSRQVASTRVALALVLASWVAWSAWLLLAAYRPPFGGLTGRYSDHAAHAGAVQVWALCGPCIWHTPADSFLVRWPAARRSELPDGLRELPAGSDVFGVPVGGSLVPVVCNWPQFVRPYPPAALVFAAPAAWLRDSGFGFPASQRVSLLVYLALLHLGFVALVVERAARPGPRLVVADLLAYLALIHWTLEGFYDAALLAPLVLCVRSLRAGSGDRALLWYAVAGLVHFRALLFFPFGALAVWQVLGQARIGDTRFWGRVAAAGLGLLVAAWVFWLTWPSLHLFPLNNPLRPAGWVQGAVVVTTLAAAARLLVLRWPMEAGLAMGIAVVLSQVRQVQAWHPLALWIWCLLPMASDTGRHPERVVETRLLLTLVLVTLVYGAPVMDLAWLVDLRR